jgi:Zn-dependent alcohol dehydrogenase
MRSRAAILYEHGRPWSVEEFELDPPRSGEVLVRLAATGLCHSDEHIRQGRLAPPPDTLRALGLPAMSPKIGGHEGSGVVAEAGDGVSGLAPGDHVVTSFAAFAGDAAGAPRARNTSATPGREPWRRGCRPTAPSAITR